MNYKFISLPKIYKYLNGNEWLLFTVLFDEWQLMKNEEGYFFRSWNSLKEDTGLSNDGLNSALKGLIEKKFISKKTYEKKTQKSNDYRIEVDYIASLIPTPKTEKATLNIEKATPKKGEGFSEKRSTSKEEITKEKNNTSTRLGEISNEELRELIEEVFCKIEQGGDSIVEIYRLKKKLSGRLTPTQVELFNYKFPDDPFTTTTSKHPN